MNSGNKSITLESANRDYKVKCPHCNALLAEANCSGYSSSFDLRPNKLLSFRQKMIDLARERPAGFKDKISALEYNKIFQYDGCTRIGTCDECDNNYYEIALFVASSSMDNFGVNKCSNIISKDFEHNGKNMIAHAERNDSSLPYPQQWRVERYDGVNIASCDEDETFRIDCHLIGLIPA